MSADQERVELELPWQQGVGSYNDACRIESTLERTHPQSRAIGVPMVTRSRIAHVVEVETGRGARAAAFIVRACNAHHDLAQSLADVLEAFETCVGREGWQEFVGTSPHFPDAKNSAVCRAIALLELVRL